MERGVVELGGHRELGAVVVAVVLQGEPRAAPRREQVLAGRVQVVAAARRGPGERDDRDEHDDPGDHGMYSTPIDGKIGSPLV